MTYFLRSVWWRLKGAPAYLRSCWKAVADGFRSEA
jgi:hypothetical protein